MGCCHYFQPTEGGDTAFTVDVSMVTFGRGCLREAGDRARALGIERAALMTDRQVGQLEYVATVRHSLEAAGVDVALYDEVRIEPTTRPSRTRRASRARPGSTASARPTSRP